MTTKSVTERPDYPNGCCPECAAAGEYRGQEQLLWLNVGRIDHLVCERHGVYWRVGENSQSENWRQQTTEERERNVAKLATMRRVKPWYAECVGEAGGWMGDCQACGAPIKDAPRALHSSNYHPVLDTMAISIDSALPETLDDAGECGELLTEVRAIQRPAHPMPLVSIEVCCPRTSAARKHARYALQRALDTLDDSFGRYDRACISYDDAPERIMSIYKELPLDAKRRLLCTAMDLAEPLPF